MPDSLSMSDQMSAVAPSDQRLHSVNNGGLAKVVFPGKDRQPRAEWQGEPLIICDIIETD
ncbi:hypothetical protein D3C72_2129630 [compost metagenome]